MDHTSREFDADLRRLSSLVGRMGGQLEELLSRSHRALAQQDAPLARAAISLDNAIDAQERDIDALCMEVLARRQPVASDLRLVTAVLKLVTDLERIGDLAGNVCERVVELDGTPTTIDRSRLARMFEIAREMVGAAIRAFATRDAAAAEAVIARDDVLDAEYHDVLRDLLGQMRGDEGRIAEAIRLQSVAKHIERTGDHATNVAELVVFMVRGEDIRHRGKSTAPGPARG